MSASPIRPLRHVLTLAPAMLAFASPARAEEPSKEVADGLVVTGSMRLRYEAIGGQARTGFNASDDLVNLRTDVHAEYRHDNLRIGLGIFDSRVWGGDARSPITVAEVNALEPVDAYVALDLPGLMGSGTKATVTAGRMMLNLGSRRLVAADDYRNTTSSYTGVRADLTGRDGWHGTFIYTLPQSRRPDDPDGLRDASVALDHESFDLVLWGGEVSKTLGRATAALTYYHLGERDAPGRPTRDRSLDTYGLRVIAEPGTGAFDYEVEALYQTGHVSTSTAANAPRQAVRAGFFHADAGYTFATAWKPRLSVEFDYASGDRRGGRYGRFDTLFGMRRADYGPSGIYASIGRTNIVTPGIRLEVTPTKRLDGFVSARTMWLAAREDSFSTTGVRDATGQSGAFAGNQIEGRVRYWLVPRHLRFEANALLLDKSGVLRRAPNATPGRTTRYASFNLTAML